MYYARTNKPGSQDSLALVLSLLWQVGGIKLSRYKDADVIIRNHINFVLSLRKYV